VLNGWNNLAGMEGASITTTPSQERENDWLMAEH
jgi:hypothetical protein